MFKLRLLVKMQNTYKSRLVVLCLGIVLGLVVTEGFVRVLDLAPQVGYINKGRYRLSKNLKIGYEPTPGLYYQGSTLDYYDYLGDETNALGYRDYDHPIKKSEDTFRIVVLGDSVSAGWGIKDYSGTYPAILEHELARNGLKSEVVNFSVPGYNTQQEVETLKAKGLSYKPDLVLLAYCLNDRQRSDGNIMATLLQSRETSKKLNLAELNPWLSKSALYRFARFRLGSSGATAQERYNLVSQDTVEYYFRELGTLSNANNFAVLIVVFPLFFGDLENYKYSSEHERIKVMSVKNNFDFLDLRLPLHRCKVRNDVAVSLDPFHPSQNGHLCIGKTIAAHILQSRKRPESVANALSAALAAGY